jgi:hypothetical protein
MTEQIKRRGRKPKVVEGHEVNWEKLAKHLQEALESSLAENAQLEQDNVKLIKDNIKLMGIASYLEKKLDRSHYSI